MELIRITCGDYDRYEELLLQLEQLEKESYYIQEEYISTFGELNNELFRIKIECIRLKKAITWYQTQLNKGLKPDPAEMDRYLQIHMAAYQQQLEEMIRDWENTKKLAPISRQQAEKVKTIYRRLAKQLHPDINPLTNEVPALYDLFQRIIIAYRANDLVEIQGLEVLADKAINELSGQHVEVMIEDIEEKISSLEERIQRITTTKPYILKLILEDPEATEKKRAEIRKEIEEYQAYQEKLASHLKELS